MTTDARLDFDRSKRIDLPEAVYCLHKTPEQCRAIVADFLTDGTDAVIATRATPEQRELLATLEPDAAAEGTFTWRHRPPTGATVAVIAAGTSDLPMAEECRLTLEAMGHATTAITDVGVAGLHRLLAVLPDLEGADVLVAFAGMEGALPTVLAGLVAQPIIAVPTSVGYGVAEGGTAALHSALASCAQGVAVVNIDNGFGAACAAVRMLRLLDA